VVRVSYRQALLFRWSRRDRLAILVIAVTVAFLVETTLLILAGGAQTAALVSEFDVTGTATFVEDPDAADIDDERWCCRSLVSRGRTARKRLRSVSRPARSGRSAIATERSPPNTVLTREPIFRPLYSSVSHTIFLMYISDIYYEYGVQS
jgi:hypothetical protein